MFDQDQERDFAEEAYNDRLMHDPAELVDADDPAARDHDFHGGAAGSFAAEGCLECQAAEAAAREARPALELTSHQVSVLVGLIESIASSPRVMLPGLGHEGPPRWSLLVKPTWASISMALEEIEDRCYSSTPAGR